MGLALILAGAGVLALGIFALSALMFELFEVDDYLTTALSEGTAEEWEGLSDD